MDKVFEVRGFYNDEDLQFAIYASRSKAEEVKTILNSLKEKDEDEALKLWMETAEKFESEYINPKEFSVAFWREMKWFIVPHKVVE